ncbi:MULTISPECIES: YqjF family protein [unclassified Lentimonas]|uniref:YqjF family protein n=1 Tax=unclassified Lentimonas TaxID=2630993 RepID=UPI0013218C46|nr:MULTISPECIES: DUF2071 domain-containing protein [unclassified Lentimonas]CAA6693728.1 Unannotated [Lentimonas sp. CC10]CAA6696380.1 Unannotated [Lentimonas sp. CC19]CAA7071643.1 Unannotated [Lentimonas sp. CC11]
MHPAPDKSRTPILYQQWRSLLFLHWQFPVAEIQARLPPGLEVDTYNGQAYIGIVPFYMHGLRPKFAPPVPSISYFPELNLRTYVRDSHGRAGVWFFSLDAQSRISVAIARKCFNLPYHYSKMRYTVHHDQSIEFQSTRAKSTPQNFRYRAGQPLGKAAKDSLTYFLVERYRLFADSKKNGLRVGELSHHPYALHQVEVDAYDTDLFALNGFSTPTAPPDHITFSPRADVAIYPMKNA